MNADSRILRNNRAIEFLTSAPSLPQVPMGDGPLPIPASVTVLFYYHDPDPNMRHHQYQLLNHTPTTSDGKTNKTKLEQSFTQWPLCCGPE